MRHVHPSPSSRGDQISLSPPDQFSLSPDSNAPPYGGTVEEYKAFVTNFGAVVVPAKILKGICDAKYGGADRTGLYNLGFTDEDIDSKGTEDLAVDMVIALKQLADKIK